MSSKIKNLKDEAKKRGLSEEGLYILDYLRNELKEFEAVSQEGATKLKELKNWKKDLKEMKSFFSFNLTNVSRHLKVIISTVLGYSYDKYYASPSSTTDFLGMIYESTKIQELCVVVDTLPTLSDGESLDISVKANAITLGTLTIDDTSSSLSTIKIPNNKLTKGNLIKLDLTYTSGTLNTLAGIYISVVNKKIKPIAS